jgi:6-phospho-beta-glucosidase
MKVALVGGAGTRVPLVVVGLVRFHEELRTSELALWDPDQRRLALIARLCEAMTKRYQVPLRITPARSSEQALENADFVLASIRVGGSAGRVVDENVAFRHGTLGQETVGAGGWAMALRSIPPMLGYAQQMQQLAPRAWLLNFTNPVGIVMQALLAAGCHRVIGVCDTPRELFETVAAELGIESRLTFFDYFGLNHLGWVRRVLVGGEDRLAPAFADPDRLARFYHVPLFEPAFLQELKLLPTEYLYFYYQAKKAVEKIRSHQITRGQQVEQQETELFRVLAAEGGKPERLLDAYDQYLARRNATYFHLETGQAVREEAVEQARRELYDRAAGYERIAVDVMRAIRNHKPTTMPVDVANHGSMDGLDELDAVEVPCLIDGNGARPLATGPVPQAVHSLLHETKHYERLTAQGALEGSAAKAIEGLAANPLIRSRSLAERLASDYRRAHRPWSDYLT